MNIAIVVGDITSTGGIERAVSRVSEILTNVGYNVTIISLFKAHKNVAYSFNPLVNLIFLSKEKYATSKQGGIKRFMMLLKSIPNLRNYFTTIKNKYDVFIGCGCPINAILYLSGLATKTIASEHTFYNYYPSLLIKIRTYLYKHFFAVTALTEKDTSLFRQNGIDCYTIPNPLTFESKTVSDLSSKRIIAVGRLSPEKGFDDLIDIMPEIITLFPDCGLHIFGEGYLRVSLEKKIARLNLQGKVVLRGNTQNIKEEYLSSSLFVLSSKYEGFAIVILEAAACGLPIISYDCPNGPGEILSQNKGILVPNGNKEILKEKIVDLLSDPIKMQYYANERERILAPYKDKIICDLWVQLLSKLIQ